MKRLVRLRFLVLAMLICLAALVIGVQAWRNSRTLQMRTARSAARAYAAALTQYRDFYIREVMGEAKAAGIELPYPSHGKDGALPLAYEFAIDLGDQLAQDDIQGRYRIYSDFPWPERRGGGVQNDSERRALDALLAGESEYTELRDSENGQTFLYAEAITMKSFCADCHNKHPSSPQRGWNEGDVRGALAIELPIADPPIVPASSDLADSSSFAVLCVVMLASLAFVASAYSRLDVEQRRDAELAVVMDSIADPVVVVDSDLKISQANPAAENMLRQDDRELTGREITSLLTMDPGAMEASDPVQVSITDSTENGPDLTMRVGELVGGKHGWVLSLRDESDLVKVQKRIAEAKKWESIGALSGGVAHDFNNILTVILSHAELLLRSPTLPVANRQGVEQIESAAKHAAELTTQLLAFGRRQPLKPESIRLNDFIVEKSRNLSRISVNHQLICETVPAGKTVWLDAQQLELALLNLVVNAREATPRGGDITIRVAETNQRDFVAVEVQDNGPGIPPELHGRVAEPFFSTKGEHGGAGLGLSSVQGFLQQSGGSLEIDTAPGGGALIRLVLPIATRVPTRRMEPTKPMEPAVASRAGRVLLVDDNEVVRQSMSLVLKLLNYEVTEASNVASAMTIVRDQPEFDLHILDVQLGPNQSGVQVALQTRQLQEDVPTVFISGYLEGEELDRIRDDEKWILLSKPCDIDELEQAIRLARQGRIPSAT